MAQGSKQSPVVPVVWQTPLSVAYLSKLVQLRSSQPRPLSAQISKVMPSLQRRSKPGVHTAWTHWAWKSPASDSGTAPMTHLPVMGQ
ncbi:MAG: hypothetical protein QM765_08625 [Myxococcales bacterium]